MLYVILAAVALAIALVGPRFVPASAPAIAKPLVRVLALAWVAVSVLSTSIVRVPADEVGVVRKIYGATSAEQRDHHAGGVRAAGLLWPHRGA
jgi:hypothetical protein